MTRKMSVVLENNLEELSVLTQMLQAFLRPYQMPSGALYALELSLEEILVNIVSYAYDDDESHEIHFKVDVDTDMIAMKFIDDGRPFNPLAAEKMATREASQRKRRRRARHQFRATDAGYDGIPAQRRPEYPANLVSAKDLAHSTTGLPCPPLGTLAAGYFYKENGNGPNDDKRQRDRTARRHRRRKPC